MRVFKRMSYDRQTPVFNIGMVSQLCGIPIWTLRWIEKHELVSPLRTGGNQRLFSEEDLEVLRDIHDLMAQDVNLPGIRVILKMRQSSYKRVIVNRRKKK